MIHSLTTKVHFDGTNSGKFVAENIIALKGCADSFKHNFTQINVNRCEENVNKIDKINYKPHSDIQCALFITR